MKKYAVSLVFTRAVSDMSIEIKSSLSFFECSSEEQALGLALKENNFPGFALQQKLVLDISDPEILEPGKTEDEFYEDKGQILYNGSQGPFRIGRKQNRAVLNRKGETVVVFEPGKEALAEEYVQMLNDKYFRR